MICDGQLTDKLVNYPPQTNLVRQNVWRIPLRN